MQENCIKIHNGSKESRSIIESQNYINQLEINDYRLRKRLKELEVLAKQYEKLMFDYKRAMEQLEHVNTELAYYQAISFTKNHGRPSKLSTQQIYEIRELRKAGNTLQTIAGQYGVSTALVHKITKDMGKDGRKKL